MPCFAMQYVLFCNAKHVPFAPKTTFSALADAPNATAALLV